MRSVELLVVGGGPAGQAAAVTAAELGVQVLLVDEGPIRESLMQRQVPRWYGERLPEPATPVEAERRYRAARPGLAEAEQLGVEVRLGCACWGLSPGLVAGVYDGELAWLVQAEQIISPPAASSSRCRSPAGRCPACWAGWARSISWRRTYGWPASGWWCSVRGAWGWR